MTPAVVFTSCSSEHHDQYSHPTRRKMVQFSDAVETIEVDLDPKLRKFRWYQRKDYVVFQEDRKETLRHLRERQVSFQGIDEQVYCLRGFEAYLSARAVQQKALRRLAAIETVIDIQLRQRRRKTGENCPKRIQAEYYRATASSRVQALERAALDAMEVEINYEDNTVKSWKNDYNRMLLKSRDAPVVPTLRAGGPLRLCRTVPSSA